MEKFVFFAATIFLLLNISNSAKYPKDLRRCKMGDTTCLNDVITEIIAGHFTGHSGLNLIPIDPLRIKTLLIAQDPKSPVNIQLKFSDVDLSGFKDTKVYKTVGFGEDPSSTSFEVRVKIPSLALIGPYEIKGSVLILPIVGSGKSNFTLENVDAVVKFGGPIEKKNGKDYLTVNKLKLDFTITRLYCYFENLFNGDKALGDNMNLFLNENWKEIFAELKPSIVDAIGEVLQIVIREPFAKLPYSELFLE